MGQSKGIILAGLALAFSFDDFLPTAWDLSICFFRPDPVFPGPSYIVRTSGLTSRVSAHIYWSDGPRV